MFLIQIYKYGADPNSEDDFTNVYLKAKEIRSNFIDGNWFSVIYADQFEPWTKSCLWCLQFCLQERRSFRIVSVRMRLLKAAHPFTMLFS